MNCPTQGWLYAGITTIPQLWNQFTNSSLTYATHDIAYEYLELGPVMSLDDDSADASLERDLARKYFCDILKGLEYRTASFYLSSLECPVMACLSFLSLRWFFMMWKITIIISNQSTRITSSTGT